MSFTTVDNLVYKIDKRIDILRNTCFSEDKKKYEIIKLIQDVERALKMTGYDAGKRERLNKILEGARNEFLKSRLTLRENNCPQSKESILLEIDNLVKRRKNIGSMNRYFVGTGKPLGVVAPSYKSISKSGKPRRKVRSSRRVERKGKSKGQTMLWNSKTRRWIKNTSENRRRLGA